MDNTEHKNSDIKSIGLKEFIYKETVNSLYKSLPSSVFATIIIGTFVVSVLSQVSDSTYLTVWFSTVTAINLGRYALYKFYFHSVNKEKNIHYWYQIFYVFLILNCLVFSSISIWLLPDPDSVYHYFPEMILIGMSAGAISSLSFRMEIIITYVLLFLAPVFIIEILIGTFISYSVSALTFLLMMFSYLNAKRFNKTIVENISLNYESKKHTEELIESRNTAVAANSAKTNFISMISHEIRTPLNGILGFTQLLKMSDQPSLNAEQNEQVDGIFYSGNHLLNLIEELLDSSMIESHKLNVSISDVSLANVVSESVATLNPVASEYNIKIINNVENVFLVKADEKRLKQVLINLVSNAIKYNHENGEVTIEIKDIGNKKVRVSVLDKGDGLTEEQQKYLFKPFTRYNDSKGGVGLGLYITQNLVELMHGKVGVESKLNKGSTFWFELPLAKESS